MHVDEDIARSIGWTDEEITYAKATCTMMNIRNRNARKKRRARSPSNEERRTARDAIRKLEEN